MYPSGEVLSNLMSNAFKQALQDTNMLAPTTLGSGLLFPTDRVGVRLGGDASITGSQDTVQLPLVLPTPAVITIGRPFGTERGYSGSDFYVDVECSVPFSVWSMSMQTQDDMEQRLLFARQHRQNVFSSYNLQIIIANTMVKGRPRPNSPLTGLVVVDYFWNFYYSRT